MLDVSDTPALMGIFEYCIMQQRTIKVTGKGSKYFSVRILLFS